MLRRFMVVGLALLFGRIAAAQDTPRDTVRLADLVVTATRLPMPRASVASTVTVLTGETLRAQGIQTVGDALRAVPGAAPVQNGSYGAVTSLFLRGGESDYVQVLVDGVQLNGPGGAFNYAALTTDNVERIEIVAGPTSVLYGSDAVAGVVQIFTRRGRGPTAIEAGVRGGTHNTLTTDAGLQGGTNNMDYSFGLSRFTTDGSYPYNNEHRNAVASGRFRVAPDPRTDATLTLRYTDNEFHYPTSFDGTLVDQNQFTFASGTVLGVDAGRRWSNRVEARVLLASSESDDGSDDQPDSSADTLGTFATASLNHHQRRSADLRVIYYLGAPGVVTTGVKIESQATRGVSESLSAFGAFSSSSHFHRVNRAGYVQALLEPVSRLSLTVGGRVDENEQFGTFGTYRAGASLRAVGGLRFRAAVGTAFKEPTFFENFDGGFSRGNPDLKPEQSASWEAGVEQADPRGRWRIAGVYFSQRFRDLIQYTFLPAVPMGPNYVNVAAAEASGFELSASVSVAGFAADASYTNLRSNVSESGFDSGPDATFVENARLLRRPTHLASVRLSRDLAGHGSVSGAVRHVGDRDDMDFSRFRRTVLPAYTVVDLSGEAILHRAQPHVSATLRVENVLDRQYAEVFNFPARGRTVTVGGRIGY